jgi:hypothetical protein
MSTQESIRIVFESDGFESTFDHSKLAYFAGTARLVNGTWSLHNTKTRGVAAGRAVYVDDERPWTGVVLKHTDHGWYVQPDGQAQGVYFHLTSDEAIRYKSVFLIQHSSC